jgi:hypothetical protein
MNNTQKLLASMVVHPEFRRRIADNPSLLPYAGKDIPQVILDSLGNSEKQPLRGREYEWLRREKDERGDEARSQRIPSRPAPEACQNCRYNNRDTTQSVCQNMQVNAPHIFVIMVMAMVVSVTVAVARVRIAAVIMLLAMGVTVRVTVRVTMIMAVVVMSKSHHTDQIHSQTQATNDEEFAETLRLRPLP